jgi:CheY-like chemotaxis protein
VKRILVIDDECVICDLLDAVLSEEGYNVATAANGREGWTQIEEYHPDLILCDVMMPLVDGRLLCRELRANKQYKTLPFVLMSAVSPPHLKDECDYSEFVHKPFDLDDILHIVQEWIGEP